MTVSWTAVAIDWIRFVLGQNSNAVSVMYNSLMEKKMVKGRTDGRPIAIEIILWLNGGQVRCLFANNTVDYDPVLAWMQKNITMTNIMSGDSSINDNLVTFGRMEYLLVVSGEDGHRPVG